MSRRGRSVAAISLFAFQDIITSVCGIVIVIVLLLAIELTNTRSVPDSTQKQMAAEVVDTSAELLRLQREIDELTRQTEANDALISRSGQLSSVEIERRSGTLSQDLARLQEQLAAARMKAAELEQQTAQAKVRDASTADQKRELAALEAELQKLKEELRQEQDSSRVRFAFPRGEERTGVLAVVSNEQILVGPIDQPTVKERFAGAAILPGYADASRDFLKWVRANQRGGYVLVLIRPSGTVLWDSLQDDLRSTGVSFGFDLIDESEDVFETPGGEGSR